MCFMNNAVKDLKNLIFAIDFCIFTDKLKIMNKHLKIGGCYGL